MVPPLTESESSGELSKYTDDSSRQGGETDDEQPQRYAETAPRSESSSSVEDPKRQSSFEDDSPRRRRTRPSWEDQPTVPVVSESSESSESSASYCGKSVVVAAPSSAVLQHGSTSATLLDQSPPPSPPLRRRASIQVLPERVEYSCSSCGESYTSRASSVFNPWWTLVRQACPKCDQCQFPWIDISSVTNQISHRPGVADDDDDDDVDDAPECHEEDDRDDERPADSEPIAPFSDEDCSFADDASDGDRLTRRQAIDLLDLLDHARCCPGFHESRRHGNVCRAAKFLMLHARDCPGTLPSGAPCPFGWCAPVKRFLAHVVQCSDELACAVCRHEAHRPRPVVIKTEEPPEALPPPSAQHKSIPHIIIKKPQPPRPPDAPPASAPGPATVVVKRAAPPVSSTEAPRSKKHRPSFDYWESLNAMVDTKAADHAVDNFLDEAALFCPDEHCAIVG